MRLLARLFAALIVFVTANGYSLLAFQTGGSAGFGKYAAGAVALLLFVLIQIFPSASNRELPTAALRNSADGCELLAIFLISTVFSVVYHVQGWRGALPLPGILERPVWWAIGILFTILAEAVVFWNGIIRIYVTSRQLRLKWRVIGALCGMIPVANLVVLGIMLHIVGEEIRVETEKIWLDEARSAEQVCRTKYPILLVHGVFFRDSKKFNYWGRIPEELKKNGAILHYGRHGSASSVADSAAQLDRRIRQIVSETGCGKVNIIAHSKGGLDCRYALAKLGTAPYVASLTTVNTPHRGCCFADYLLEKIPERQQRAVAKAYNKALAKIGDKNPDFMAAVRDLTGSFCRELDRELKKAEPPEGVYCQSVGSRLNVPSGGQFPLNFSYHLVRRFDGPNDGLVGVESFYFGENYRFVSVRGKRGVSHGDMIDLNRENLPEFDVREFYVELVGDLKKRGL